MSTQDKVARYLKDRKKLVEAKTMATYFLVSIDTIRRALQRLEHEDKVVRLRVANVTYWSWKLEPTAPVAVPQTTYQVQPSEPTAVRRPPPKIQTSYPHIRGYDD